MLYIITFLYIFGFRIYSIIDSTILIGIILSILMMFNKKYMQLFNKRISQKKTYRVIIAYLILFCISCFAYFVGECCDFSYIKTLLHFLIVIIVGIEVVSYFDLKGKNAQILNCILICFIIQSFFQWTCYLFPSFSTLFNAFRSPEMLTKSIQYSGYRGIALTQSGFFSLSSSYALIFILFFSDKNTLFKKPFIKYLFYIVLISGTFFAGRTGYVGLLLVAILLFRNFHNQNYRISMKKIISVFLIIIIAGTLLINFAKNTRLSNIYNYTFQLINNYRNGNGFTSTSTDKLLDMYDRDIPTKTLLIGDGRYSDDGSYYMKTDVGYLRKIFYFGIFGLLASVFLQIAIINNGKIKYENIIILLLLLILELKGDIIGLSIMVNSVIILYSYTDETKIYGKNNYINDNL